MQRFGIAAIILFRYRLCRICKALFVLDIVTRSNRVIPLPADPLPKNSDWHLDWVDLTLLLSQKLQSRSISTSKKHSTSQKGNSTTICLLSIARHGRIAQFRYNEDPYTVLSAHRKSNNSGFYTSAILPNKPSRGCLGNRGSSAVLPLSRHDIPSLLLMKNLTYRWTHLQRFP